MAGSRKDAASEFADQAPVDVVIKASKRRKKSAQEAAFKISTTAPEEIRRHNISDEELEMLSNLRQDGLSDAFWALVGGAIAASPAAVAALWGAFVDEPPVALGALHLMEVVILVGTVTPAIAIGAINCSRKNRTKDLVGTIRARASR